MDIIESNNTNQEIVQIAVELLREGTGNKEVERLITESFPEISHSDLSQIMVETLEIVNENQFTKPGEIIAIHTMRYNNRVKQLLSVQDPDDLPLEERRLLSPERYWSMRKKKIQAMNDLLNTLQQKEELLQYHNESFEIEVNNEETFEIREKDPQIDISKLNLEEQVELLELFKKAKIGYKEIPSITPANDSVAVELHTHDKLIEEELNVSKIKLEETKITEELLPFRTDPKSKLMASHDIASLKALQEAGANLTEEEQKLLK